MSTLLFGAVEFGPISSAQLESPVNMCDSFHKSGPSLLPLITAERERRQGYLMKELGSSRFGIF